MITTTIALWRMFSLIYIHTYIYIYICTYIHTYIHTYIPFLLLVRDSCRRKALQVAPRNLFFCACLFNRSLPEARPAGYHDVGRAQTIELVETAEATVDL